jgi:enamine deaminase RidA (YjgF/YER057c/UK114 family)
LSPEKPDAPGKLSDTIEEQTRAVMENLRLVLAGLDLGFEHVVMARIYLTHRRCPDRSGARQRRQAAWICRNKRPRATAEMFCCRHFPDIQSRVAADWL